MAFEWWQRDKTRYPKRIHLDRAHVNEPFTRRVHLYLALHCLRPFAHSRPPLLLFLLLGRDWGWFFPDFENAQRT